MLARRPVIVFATLLVLASGSAAAGRRARMLMLVDPDRLDLKPVASQLAAFGRLIERGMGWAEGVITVRAVAANDALPDLRMRGVALAILTDHAFARIASRFLTDDERFAGLEILGHARDLEGALTARWLVARKDASIDQHIERHPGLRLALPRHCDVQWIRVLVDGLVDPETHFRLVPVKDTDEGIGKVASGAADLVFVDERDKASLAARLHPLDGDLKVAYLSPAMPKKALVTFGAALSTGERRRLRAVLDALCTRDGLAICSGLGFLDLQPGMHPLHPHLAYKYKHYK